MNTIYCRRRSLLVVVSALSLLACVVSSASVVDVPIGFRTTLATVELGIGTPAKNHTFLFDTGSTDAWVVDSECAELCDNQSGVNRTGYDAAASSTHHDLGTYARIGYVSWNVGGRGTADLFSAGAAVWNQTFLAVNDSNAATVPVDGFLGFGFSTGSRPGVRAMVETMVDAGVVAQPRFGIYYGTALDERRPKRCRGDHHDGALSIGGSKEAQYVQGGGNGVRWLPVVSFGGRYIGWISGLHGINTATPKAHVARPVAPGSAAVFDTGSSVTLLPAEHFDVVYAAIGWDGHAANQGRLDMPCTAFNSSWSVSFDVGGADVGPRTTLSIRGDQMRVPGLRGSEDLCYPPFGMLSEGLMVVGAPILHRLYTIWDYGGMSTAAYRPMIGLGRLKEDFAPGLGH